MLISRPLNVITYTTIIYQVVKPSMNLKKEVINKESVNMNINSQCLRIGSLRNTFETKKDQSSDERSNLLTTTLELENKNVVKASTLSIKRDLFNSTKKQMFSTFIVYLCVLIIHFSIHFTRTYLLFLFIEYFRKSSVFPS